MKATRAVERENKKVSKAATEVIWKNLLDVHKLAVTTWEAKGVVLQENGTGVKDLPMKYKRPIKPKPTVDVKLEPLGTDSEQE